MRTADFSKAPPLSRAEAMVVTDAAASLRGRRGLVRERRWRERRSVKRGRGRQGGAAGGIRPDRGTIAWFETAAQAEAVAADLRATGAGTFVHRFAADPMGYSNGVWRAEPGPMAHEEHFAPLAKERERGVPGPVVADPRAARWSKARDRRPAEHDGLADAGALFVGATRYRGPISIAIQSRTWFPMVRRMRQLPGFRWVGVYWEPPFTLGTIAFFGSVDDMMVFARIPEHRYLMQWVVQGTKHATGGWIRVHERVDAYRDHPHPADGPPA